MSYHMHGKAILYVEKDGDDLYITIIPLTGATTYQEQQWLSDVIQNAAFCNWYPNQCNRMEPGDRIIFKVNYYLSFYKGDGYTSDDDEELVFSNARKLYHRRGIHESRKSLKKYYQSKRK